MALLPVGPDFPDEVWKSVEGHELHYEVSNMGRVRTTPRIVGSEAANGYLNANMPGKFKGFGSSRGRKRDTGFRVPIHRLVAETFLEKVPEKTEINHVDGNKLNNRASNLEYCNRSENVKHGYAIGLHGDRHKKKRLTDDDYREVRRLYSAGGHTHETLAVKFNVTAVHVGYILHRTKRAR